MTNAFCLDRKSENPPLVPLQSPPSVLSLSPLSPRSSFFPLFLVRLSVIRYAMAAFPLPILLYKPLCPVLSPPLTMSLRFIKHYRVPLSAVKSSFALNIFLVSGVVGLDDVFELSWPDQKVAAR